MVRAVRDGGAGEGSQTGLLFSATPDRADEVINVAVDFSNDSRAVGLQFQRQSPVLG